MSPKYYCPACGGGMSENVSTMHTSSILKCESCDCFMTHHRQEQIERRTLARIEEAERPLVEALESAKEAMRVVSVKDQNSLRIMQDAYAALGKSLADHKARAAERGKT